MASSKVEVEAPATGDIEETFEVPSTVEEKVATPTEEAEVVVHEDDDEEEEEEVETALKEENGEKEIASPLVENEVDEPDATFDDDDDDDDAEAQKLEDY
ncbi:hypothetical protein Patl1_03111 [Pistacia atlantica]|uniref:Uncharacterized protein n=1 Tax=Pistacia atlantica TaxID=434234 RepID=A0ACC1C6L6_9ROSI|nr:hypothetical protein Patl1_03111 [Pistacia atlantica]